MLMDILSDDALTQTLKDSMSTTNSHIVDMLSNTFSKEFVTGINKSFELMKLLMEQLQSELELAYDERLGNVEDFIKQLRTVSHTSSGITEVSNLLVNNLIAKKEMECPNSDQLEKNDNDIDCKTGSEIYSDTDDAGENNVDCEKVKHEESGIYCDGVNIDIYDNISDVYFIGQRKTSEASSLDDSNDYKNSRKKYKHDLRGKGFPCKNEFQDHRVSLITSMPFQTCGICSIDFLQKWELLDHCKKEHFVMGKYYCHLCNYKVKTLNIFLKHVSSKHNTFETSIHGHTQEKERIRVRSEDFGLFKNSVKDPSGKESHQLLQRPDKHSISGPKGKGSDTCNEVKFVELKLAQREVVNEKKKVKAAKKQIIFCKECNKQFTCGSSLKRHTMIHENRKPFHCLFCSKSFRRKIALKNHELMHAHKEYKCNLCNHSSSTLSFLEKHVLEHKVDGLFPCDSCDYMAKTAHKLSQHKTSHESKNCRQCEYIAKNLSDLRIHQRENHANIACTQCDYVCHTNSQLKQHLVTHNKDDPPKETFFCELCAFTCHAKKQFTYHLLRHSDRKPLSCPYCDYKCSSTSSLTAHKLKHTGLKPFLCSDCGMSFVRSDHLKKHLLIHKGEKPFVCKTCGRAFRASGNLKVHERIHSGQQKQQKCHLCPFACRRRKELDIHMADQHTVRSPADVMMELSHPLESYGDMIQVEELGMMSVPFYERHQFQPQISV